MRLSVRHTYRWLTPIILVFTLAILINPRGNIDIALLSIMLLIIGHAYLGEKLLLVFLIIRPTVDYWRNFALFYFRDTAINLNVALAILFLAWSVLMLVKHRRELARVPLRLLLPLTAMLMLVSALYSVAPLNSLLESIKFINLVAFFWLGFIFSKIKKLKSEELLSAIALSAVAPILFALWQLISGSGLATFAIRGRLYGTLAHPNVLAFLLLSLIILHTQTSIIQPINYYKNKRWLIFAIYSLLIILLLFTYTRVAFIGLAVFLIIICWHRYHKMLIRAILVFALFVLIFFPLNNYLINTFNVNLQKIPIIGRISARDEDADSLAWRQSVLRETLPIIQARPWLGYGYGTFPLVWKENQNLRHQWDDSTEAHNDYLRLALEIGIIGLAIYLLTLGRLVQLAARPLARIKNKSNQSIHLLGWIIAFVIVSLSDNMLHHTPVMWLAWTWWGAMLADTLKRNKQST